MGESRMTGKVKWFSDQKGFGFITPDEDGEDLFVHQSSIRSEGFRSLAEGEEVEFVIESSEGGRTKAVDVTGPNGNPVRGTSRSGRGGGGHGGGGGYGGGGSGGYGDGGYGGGGRRGGYGGGGYGGGGGGGCFKCGEMGHMARDCEQGDGGGGGRYGGGGGGRYGGGGGGRYGGGGLACYNCGGSGHFARECPNNSVERV
ncbi:hypothetical protein CRYUN_Cryun18bG0117700 [Craigia yunnanensis]